MSMMKRFFIAAIGTLALFLSAALAIAQEDFMYDSHGRRDPFWPLVSSSGAILSYDDSLQFSDMVLEGVIYDPDGERFAIINSRVVKIEDRIGGFVVTAVNQDSVTLYRQGQEFSLNLKKE